MGCYNKDIFALKRGFYPEHLCMVCVVLLKSAVFLTFRVFGSNWNVLAGQGFDWCGSVGFQCLHLRHPRPHPQWKKKSSWPRPQSAYFRNQVGLSGPSASLLSCCNCSFLFFCVCVCVCVRERVCVCVASPFVVIFSVCLCENGYWSCVCVWPLLL